MAQMWKPSERFARLYGETVGAAKGAAIVASIMVNGDSVPDLVALTAELANAASRTHRFDQVSVIAAASGLSFDGDGWAIA